MIKSIILSTLFLSFSTHLFSQDLSVPDSILHELNTSIFIEGSDTLCFKYVYPKDYDSTKNYPVFLGLSGGDQNEFIVDYCYAAWFRSNYFKNYFTILPVNILHNNLIQYSPSEIELVYKSIQSHFNVSAKNWIIAGTSNGGVAVYNFVAQKPALFYGLITMPGSKGELVKIDSTWSHLHVLNAVGENDSDGWKNAVYYIHDSTGTFLKKNDVMVLKDVGHILPISFNIDTVYQRYFTNTLGLDGKIELNNAEIEYLSQFKTLDQKHISLSGLKVAFISGSGGSRLISKQDYFSYSKHHSSIIPLTEKEKIQSGGYDVLISQYVKFQPKKYRKRIIKTLSKL